MKVSVEDFKELPVISGNLNLKWELRKLIPEIDIHNLVECLDVTYQAKYLANVEEYSKNNPEFDEAPVWQYIAQYKVKLDEKGLSIFLVIDYGNSHGYLFEIDKKNKRLRQLN